MDLKNSIDYTKPDSARIKYRLEPPEYANPDIAPSPLKMEVEIKDKDGNLVYGPRDLTLDEQRNQLLWWNGIDNKGDTVSPTKGPFKVEISLKYKEGSSTSSSFSPTTSSVLASATKTLDGEAKDDVDVREAVVKIEDLDRDIDPELPEGQQVRESKIQFKTFPKELNILEFLLTVKDVNNSIFCEEVYSIKDLGTTEEFKRIGEDNEGFIWQIIWNGKDTEGNVLANAENNPYSVEVAIRIEGQESAIESKKENIYIVKPIPLGWEEEGEDCVEDLDDADWCKVYIPDKYGGKLEAKIDVAGNVEIYKHNMTNKVNNPYELPINVNEGEPWEEHGWYYLKIYGTDGCYKISTTFTQEGQASKIPWSGWWWPDNKCELANGYKPDSDPPLKKYDDYIVALGKPNPNVQQWVRDNRCNPDAPGWYGLCDAWSNAAIREVEPTDASNHEGILFYVGDKKGLLTEMWSGASLNEFTIGNTDNHNDVPAIEFHHKLCLYIRNQGKPIAMDLNNAEEVWSHPVFSYRSEIKSARDISHRFELHFFTTITYIDYATHPDDIGSIQLTSEYDYWLQYKENGDMCGYIWWDINNNSENRNQQPDVIWCPFSSALSVGLNLDINIVKDICK